jgi:hypothetical protein
VWEIPDNANATIEQSATVPSAGNLLQSNKRMLYEKSVLFGGDSGPKE